MTSNAIDDLSAYKLNNYVICVRWCRLHWRFPCNFYWSSLSVQAFVPLGTIVWSFLIQKSSRFSSILRIIHHPFLDLMSLFLWTLSFSNVFWPIRSLRFLFLLNAINGFFLKTGSKLELICNKCQCLSIAPFMSGNFLLYVTTQGILLSGFLSLLWRSKSLFCDFALDIWIFISSSLHFLNFNFLDNS